MLFIAHRGNSEGPNPSRENHPSYISEALDRGYHVEIDVWLVNNELFLGHDTPQYETTLEFLQSNNRLVCHAKNADALAFLIKNDLHCFGHDQDDVVLTSKGWLWTFPGKPLTSQSIAVMPERVDTWNIADCLGICSDYVGSLGSNSKYHTFV